MTGAAGGIGSAVSAALVSQRCRVAMVDIDAAALAAVRQELEEEAQRGGAEVSDVVADVTTEEGARRAVDGRQGPSTAGSTCWSTSSVAAGREGT